MSIFDKFKYKRMDIPKTPKYGVSDAHKKRIKKELDNAETRLKRLSGGGSYVERPPRTDRPQLPKIPNHNPNVPIKTEVPEFRPKLIKRDYMPFVPLFLPSSEDMVREGYIPPDWNKLIEEDKPMKRDIMKEIEWEYSEEGAKELRHLFAMWHLNDEVWQRQRRKAINLAVYGEEDPFNAKPYYHIVTFSDEHGFKLTQYPKHQKEEAYALFNNYNEAWHTPNNVLFFEGEEIGHIFLGGTL